MPDGVRALTSNVAPEALKSMLLNLNPEEAPLIANVPPFTVVVPERLIPPVAVNVPALILVKLPLLPEIAPELVRLKLFVSMVSVSPLPIDIASSIFETVALNCNVPLPRTFKVVPLFPKEAFELICIVPPFRVVPPAYVFDPSKIRVPNPFLDNAAPEPDPSV